MIMLAEAGSLEIEAKFRVVSHDRVRNRLSELRISVAGIEEQRDVYYASPTRDFGCTDEALRVRYTGDEVILTYKGPKIPSLGLKAREEVNIRVDSGKNMEMLLQHLGFSPAYIVEKRRERYEREGIEIGLDDVKGLGTFVEIELKEPGDHPEETIEMIKKELEIEGEHIPLSYLELLRLTESSDRSGYPFPPH
jgi:adenylate cyclase class 2